MITYETDSDTDSLLMRLAALARVEDFLVSDEGPEELLSIAELDGFLTGLAAGPEPISEAEWLPLILGNDAPAPDEKQHRQDLTEIVLEHYADIVRKLDEGVVAPIFWSSYDLSVGAGDWATGFATAMTLRPEHWSKLANSGSSALLAPVLILYSPDSEELFEDLDDEEWSTLMADSEKALPASIVAIARYWRMTPAERRAVSTAFTSDVKVGRNSPCPCGSGRKFKKCCGA